MKNETFEKLFKKELLYWQNHFKDNAVKSSLMSRTWTGTQEHYLQVEIAKRIREEGYSVNQGAAEYDGMTVWTITDKS